jgi:hypothetical protein
MRRGCLDAHHPLAGGLPTDFGSTTECDCGRATRVRACGHDQHSSALGDRVARTSTQRDIYARRDIGTTAIDP